MIRAYAKFSKNSPAVHIVILVLLSVAFVFSIYQLLANNAVWFAIPLIGSLPLILFFGKASDYRRKFLHD